MKPIIDECRRRFGKPPREFSFMQRWHLGLWRPYLWLLWDPLKVIYKDQKKTRELGEVVWAHLVQANQLVYERRTDDCPGEVIFSFDPFFDDHPDQLGAIAGGLYELKGTTPAHPGLARIAHHLTNEMTRQARCPVPPEVTGGREVFLTTIMFVRKHLPDHAVTQPLFPLVACRDAAVTTATMILPARYWSPALLEFWGKPT